MTCTITESASSAKIPPMKSSRNIVCVKIAIAARAPPIAIAPVSPMITSAGKALYQRKPIAAPISAAPTMARSRRLSKRPPGFPERMYVTTEIAVKVSRAMIPVPAARPSRPSVRLTPLAAPAITRKSSPYQAQESSRCPMPGTYTLVGRCWWRAAMPTPIVIAPSRSSFQRAFRPSDRRCVSLMKSSMKPIAPQARVTKSTVSAGTVYLATARYATVPAPSIKRPPMIGVPCLVTWCWGPSSRIVCPYSLRRRKAMKRGPARMEISIAARPAIRTRTKLGLDRRQRFRDRFEPHRPRTLDENGVSGANDLVELAQRLVNVWSPARGDPGRTIHVAPCELADGEQFVDSNLRDCRADFVVVAGRCPAQLRHVAENCDPSAFACPCGEVVECRAHRHRIRVVRVIDQHASAGQLLLLAAPAGEVHVDAFGPRQPQRVERRQGGGRVGDLMPGDEVEADFVDDRAVADHLR